jgi:hypothetical protein
MAIAYKALLFFLLSVVLNPPLLAQVRPLPRNPIEPPPPTREQAEGPREPTRPAGPMENPAPNLPAPPSVRDRGVQPDRSLRIFTPPVIELASGSQRTPGRLASLSIKVSNLGNAKAVHLYALDFGCPIDVQPVLNGQQLFVHPFSGSQGNVRPRLTSDRNSTVRGAYDPELEIQVSIANRQGIPVDANGVAYFALSGVPGVTPFFRNEVTRQPDVVEMQTHQGPRGSAYDPYIRQLINVDANNATCIPSAIIALRDDAGEWYTFDSRGARLSLPGNFSRIGADRPMPMLVRGKAWFLAPARRVTVEDTSQLTRVFAANAKGQGAGSICSDTSRTPYGSFPVGVLERGRDLAFVIRSGPLGTRCRFEIPSAALPDGVGFVNAEFEVSAIGEHCRLDSLEGSSDMGGVFKLDRITRAVKEPAVITRPGRVGLSSAGWLNPYIFPDPGLTLRWQRTTAPMIAFLDCKSTLVNDHEVALIMRRATFTVPEGVRFP